MVRIRAVVSALAIREEAAALEQCDRIEPAADMHFGGPVLINAAAAHRSLSRGLCESDAGPRHGHVFAGGTDRDRVQGDTSNLSLTGREVLEASRRTHRCHLQRPGRLVGVGNTVVAAALGASVAAYTARPPDQAVDRDFERNAPIEDLACAPPVRPRSTDRGVGALAECPAVGDAHRRVPRTAGDDGAT